MNNQNQFYSLKKDLKHDTWIIQNELFMVLSTYGKPVRIPDYMRLAWSLWDQFIH